MRNVLLLITTLAMPLTANSQRFSEWSAPVNLGQVINSTAQDQGPFVSKNERTLYFTSTRPGGFGTANDIWVSTRPHKKAPWGPAVNVARLNTTGTESTPTLSRGERHLFFASDRAGTTGSLDLWVSAREDKDDDLNWGEPVNLGPAVNSTAGDLGPTFFRDKESGIVTLYFYSTRLGGPGRRDIYQSTMDKDGQFTPAVLVPELSTAFEDEQPAIRRDGLEIFFASTRDGTSDIFVSTRATTSDPWSPPVNLGPVINTARTEGRPAISHDGRSLYFFSDGHGGFGGTDLFVSTREKLDIDGDEEEDDEEEE